MRACIVWGVSALLSSAVAFGDIPRASPDLLADSQRFLQFVQSDDFKAEDCEPVIGEIWQELFAKPATYFDAQKSQQEILQTIQNIWLSQIALRKKLGQFYSENAASPGCVNTMRIALKVGRFLIDSIGSFYLKGAPGTPLFTGDAPHLMVNPAYGAFDADQDLRSGDVILSRYHTNISAAIARIGNEGSQFSHLSIIYIDEKTGKRYTIESLIETGVVIRPYETGHAKDDNVRESIYRYPDPQVAKAAAQAMYDYAQNYLAKNGENIPYDYQMDPDDFTRIACPEVVHYGYYTATQGALYVPIFQSEITQGKNPVLESLQIHRSAVFAPGDMEVDPRFDLLVEWRNFSALDDLHIKDAVLTKIFDWMILKDYKLHGTLGSKLIKWVVPFLRQLSFFEGMIAKDTPSEMVETMKLIDWTAEVLNQRLRIRDQRHYNRTGFNMTPKEMYDELEILRLEDLEQYMNAGENQEYEIFHNYLRPSGI